MSIDRRRDLQEKLFVSHERRSFDERARADREVGRWAAQQLGLEGQDIDAYAGTVINAGVVSREGRGGFDKVASDLAAIGLSLDTIRIRYAAAMDECMNLGRSVATANPLYA
ncbi:ATPase inhibitor subunit zeta [Aureimonas ureilytica]|uniref:ATPase inhibitor subunit zeta n=1 Tax=Aureimonas ureilytica TaxID=401562 RepID=UPI00036ABECC|nr:ATPase inhibitor subunit zeta [Aureimonas ureilytica]